MDTKLTEGSKRRENSKVIQMCLTDQKWLGHHLIHKSVLMMILNFRTILSCFQGSVVWLSIDNALQFRSINIIYASVAREIRIPPLTEKREDGHCVSHNPRMTDQVNIVSGVSNGSHKTHCNGKWKRKKKWNKMPYSSTRDFLSYIQVFSISLDISKE